MAASKQQHLKTTSPELFGVEVGNDDMYNRVRVPAADAPEQLLNAREFSERLWRRTADYLDEDLPTKASQHFHQAFWEMYLAATLLELGLPLVARNKRQRPGVGPDLQIAPNIWVEAIAVLSGSGPDAVPDNSNDFSKTHTVPDGQLRLRLVSGMMEKRIKFEKYRKNGVVGPEDVCVVAINTAMLGIHSDFFPPRIVRALFEFGWPQMNIELDTQRVVASGHSHAPSVSKLSGNTVGQGMFLDGTSTFLSACIYSAANFAFTDLALGGDFIVVHNPTASAPLPRGLISAGDECWAEANNLSYKRGE